MKKQLLALMAALCITGAASAQTTNVGIGTIAPNAAAQLDVTAPNMGFLAPRLALNGASVWTLTATPTDGMMVFNTATVSGSDAISPGYYFWMNSKWNPFFSNPAITFDPSTAGTGVVSAYNCATPGTDVGTLQTGVTASGNSHVITATVTSVGSYNITTTAMNGVTWSASGNFTATGAQTITLVASGTPTASGSTTYTLSTTPNCSFTRTVTSPATFACGNATQTQSPAGALNAGSYTGSYTIPYTAGNGGSYASSTQTISGLTLTRVAGTYSAGGGNVVYNLTGSYTGPANGIVTFTIPECTTAIFGDAIRGALSAGGCASCVAYDAATVNTWIQVTSAEYTALANSANISGATKSLATDAQMALTSNNTSSSNTLASDINLIPASSYPYAYKFIPANTATQSGVKVKIQTTANTVSGPYVDLGGILPSANTTANVPVYYVLKRPTQTTYSGSASNGAMYPGNGSIRNVSGSGGNYYYGGGDVNTLSAAGFLAIMQHQLLSTTSKQW